MIWEPAPDIQQRLNYLIQSLQLTYINPTQLYIFRSHGSKARARARIWSLPTIWQQALNVPPAYCIEVVSEHFDCLSTHDQDHTLTHELLHIPKTFSGALLPHKHRGGRVDRRTVETLLKKFFS